MSDAEETKSEELSFDVDFSTPSDDAGAGAGDFGDSFDFSSFLADEAPSTDSNAEVSAGFEFADVAEPPDEAAPVAETEFPAEPSSFLTGADEEPVAEPEAAVVETSKKKGKKENPPKKKKEKKEKAPSGPREPMDLGAMLSLCFAVGTLLVWIVFNVLFFLRPEMLLISRPTSIFFAVLANVFGLMIVGIPFLLWKLRKGEKEEQNLQMFDVLLGIALMAIVIGVLCFLKDWNEYDFTIKAAKPSVNVQDVA